MVWVSHQNRQGETSHRVRLDLVIDTCIWAEVQLISAERVSTAPPPNRFQTAQKTASGYIPNSVSATATSMGDRVKDGFDSIATQQRREQVGQTITVAGFG